MGDPSTDTTWKDRLERFCGTVAPERLRRFLVQYPDAYGRVDSTGCLLIHHICRWREGRRELLEVLLDVGGTEQLLRLPEQRDNDIGLHPLFTVARDRFDDGSFELLLRANPQVLETKMGHLPCIHTMAIDGIPAARWTTLVTHYPHAARLRSDSDTLLHTACRSIASRPSSWCESFACLAQHLPDLLHERNQRDQTPLEALFYCKESMLECRPSLLDLFLSGDNDVPVNAIRFSLSTLLHEAFSRYRRKSFQSVRRRLCDLLNAKSPDFYRITVRNGDTVLLSTASQPGWPFQNDFPELLEHCVDCVNDITGEYPLHRAIRRDLNAPVMAQLLEAYPPAAKERDREGFLPLHICLTRDPRRGTGFREVLSQVLEAYPAAVLEPTPPDGKLPFVVAAEKSFPVELIFLLIVTDPLVLTHPQVWIRPRSRIRLADLR